MSIEQRISRHVIAEQHLALTETFHSSRHAPDVFQPDKNQTEFIGEVFLRCNAKEVVERCAATAREMSEYYGPDVDVPEIKIHGHLTATLTYIPAHLEYIIGELLRNSVQAAVEQGRATIGKPAAINVLICETPQHVIFRISDQGGGASRAILPDLWSFVKGPRHLARLENLNKIAHLSASLQEANVRESVHNPSYTTEKRRTPIDGSLRSLTRRPPNLRLGIGLPMSRVYAEYWAGSLELHSLEGYGVDAVLQISKLGNKNEQLSTRATMDGL